MVSTLRAVLSVLGAAGGMLATTAINADPVDAAQQASPQAFYLEAFVNGVDKGLLIRVDREAGHFYITADELTEIGIRVADLPLDADKRITLDNIAGLRYAYRAAEQRIDFTLPDARLVPERIGYQSEPVPAPQSGTGLVLNYVARLQSARVGVAASQPRAVEPALGVGYSAEPVGDSAGFVAGFEHQNQALSIGSDLRFFSPMGSFVNYGYSTLQDGNSEYTREDTYWIYSSLQSLRTYTVGDFISSSLPWTRAVRLGGMEISRNFGLRPDLVTFPVPALGGSAVVPTTVDVFVNGMRQFSGEASGGPFVIATPLALTGAGTVAVAYQNALGLNVVSRQPLYVDSRLLADGLVDYSVETGYLRQDYGTRSFSYSSSPAASASLRYGLNDWLTLESHTEMTHGLGNLGFGGLLGIGEFGVINAALAASGGAGHGFESSVGYQYITQRWGIFLGDLRTYDTYRDLGSTQGSPVPGHLSYASLSLSVAPNHGLILHYVRQQASAFGGSRIAALSYSGNFGHAINVFANYFKDLELHDSGGLFVGLSVGFKNHTSAYSSVSRYGDDRTLTVGTNKSVDYDRGGFGWNAVADIGNQDYQHGAARLDYRGSYGDVSALIERARTATTTNTIAALYASGALVYLDGELLASRSIPNAFAVVSTDHVAGIPVLHENSLVGLTNSSGHLLVPDLLSFQSNHLAIDTLNLPVTAQVEIDKLVVAPRDRSGVTAHFPIGRYQGATIILLDRRHTPLPVGTRVTLLDTGDTALVGYDGQVFFPQLRPLNHLSAQIDENTCKVDVSFDASQVMGTIGAFVCAAANPP